MPLALLQKILPDLTMQGAQSIELLVEKFSPATYPGLADLSQPFAAMARCVDLLAPAGNSPASIQSLQSIHHPDQILRDGQVAAGEFFQSPQTILSVVDR